MKEIKFNVNNTPLGDFEYYYKVEEKEDVIIEKALPFEFKKRYILLLIVVLLIFFRRAS